MSDPADVAGGVEQGQSRPVQSQRLLILQRAQRGDGGVRGDRSAERGCRRFGATAVEVAGTWIRAQVGITSTLIGSRTLQQFDTNVSSLAFELPDDARRALDEVSKPRLNFPAENNAQLAPAPQFNGLTVDGVRHPVNRWIGAAPKFW